jgi:hypothetical protein
MDLFTGRDRTRLRRARENGYLHLGRKSPQAVKDAYSFWCWRLRIPVVWYERASPRSKFGRVCVDLFTTAHALSARGQYEMRELGARSISAHDARWERVPRFMLEQVAKAALRAASRQGNYEVVEPVKAAAASNVLPFKISA